MKVLLVFVVIGSLLGVALANSIGKRTTLPLNYIHAKTERTPINDTGNIGNVDEVGVSDEEDYADFEDYEFDEYYDGDSKELDEESISYEDEPIESSINSIEIGNNTNSISNNSDDKEQKKGTRIVNNKNSSDKNERLANKNRIDSQRRYSPVLRRDIINRPIPPPKLNRNAVARKVSRKPPIGKLNKEQQRKGKKMSNHKISKRVPEVRQRSGVNRKRRSTTTTPKSIVKKKVIRKTFSRKRSGSAI